MKRVIFLGCFLLAVVSLGAQSFDKAKMDSLFMAIDEYHKGMGSVSVFRNGQEVYQRSFGYSDVENGVKNSDHTKFRIGSITKTFTATVIMKLIEENKLSLDTRLAAYYPRIPNADKITIAHLLQHRSGLSNFINVSDYLEWNSSSQTKEQLLERIISGGTTFAPDAQFGYSNSNYVLLTFIAEDVSSVSFSDLLRDLIIKPCGLENTYTGGRINPENDEAYSYVRVSADWKKSGETDMSIPLGAGNIVSTPYDLNRFFYCLFSEKIVSRESLDQMKTLQDNFGFGLFQVPFYEIKGYGHTGGIDGFQANAYYFPDSNVSIALIENGVVYMLNNIILGSLSIYFGKEYQIPTFSNSIEVNPELLDAYTGIYSSPDMPIKITIFRKDNSLFLQGTGQPEIPLESIAFNRFVYEAVDLVLEFIPNENKMVLKQMGMTFEMTKE